MTDSRKLLAEYVEAGSEPAFRELVARYLGLVYSAAVRMMDGDTHRAEDVAQTVFADLARMARALSSEVMLGGWLHRRTCHVAATILRGERRRQSREKKAVEMNALQGHSRSEANLAQVAPILDEAINQLGADDRTAILLRFFEQRDFHSIGQVLGSSEDAAQKRVTRALEKLHSLLKHRGITFSAAALGTALATEAVTATPAGLAVSISSAALASAAVGSGTTLTLLKIITMTKLKLGIISAIAFAQTVAWDPDVKAQAQAMFDAAPEAVRQKFGSVDGVLYAMMSTPGQAQDANVTGFGVVSQNITGNDGTLIVQEQHTDGQVKQNPIPMQQFDDGWRVLLPPKMLNQFGNYLNH